MQMSTNFLGILQTVLYLLPQHLLFLYFPHLNEVHLQPLRGISPKCIHLGLLPPSTLISAPSPSQHISQISPSSLHVQHDFSNPQLPDLLDWSDGLLMSLHFYFYSSFSSNPKPTPFSTKQPELLKQQT